MPDRHAEPLLCYANPAARDPVSPDLYLTLAPCRRPVAWQRRLRRVTQVRMRQHALATCGMSIGTKKTESMAVGPDGKLTQRCLPPRSHETGCADSEKGPTAAVAFSAVTSRTRRCAAMHCAVCRKARRQHDLLSTRIRRSIRSPTRWRSRRASAYFTDSLARFRPDSVWRTFKRVFAHVFEHSAPRLLEYDPATRAPHG